MKDLQSIDTLVQQSERALQDGNIWLALQLMTAGFRQLIAAIQTANSEQQTANGSDRFQKQESKACRGGYHDFCYHCICPCHMMSDKP